MKAIKVEHESVRQLDVTDVSGIKEIGARMRQARVEQGLTLRAVAEAAGVSPGTVQKIEVGRLVPSIEIFLKVAKALRRRVSYFFAEDDEKSDLRLIRRESARIVPTRSRARIASIAEPLRDPKMEACIIDLPAGAQSGRPLTYAGELLFYCLGGTVRFLVRGRTEILRDGDTLHLKADIPHRWENPGKAPAWMLAVWVQG